MLAEAHAADPQDAEGLTTEHRWALAERGLTLERWPGGYRVRAADGSVVKMLAPDPAAVATWLTMGVYNDAS